MLSAIVLTKNSTKYLNKLFDNLDFCDEIVVVDDCSSDGTIRHARNLGANVFERKLDNFSKQRNFAMSKANGDWLLFVDSDEIVDAKLRNQITSSVVSNKHDGYFLKRKDIFLGKEISFGPNSCQKIVRLAKKEKSKWTRAVHEKLEVDGKTSILRGFLLHNHDKTLSQYVKSIDLYSNLHANSNEIEGKKSTMVKIIFWPILKFVYLYLLRLNFLNGTRGFLTSAFSSFHSYLSWSKQWLNQKKNH